MKLIIKESKLTKIIFDYFENNPNLFPLRSDSGWNPESTNYFPMSSDADESPDYSFSYYPTEDTYDYPDTYDKNEFPLIEVNYAVWVKIVDMFGEKITSEYLLKWLNDSYGLKAVSIHPG